MQIHIVDGEKNSKTVVEREEKTPKNGDFLESEKCAFSIYTTDNLGQSQ